MKAVDSHAHVFRADSALTADARYRPAGDATPETYLAHLDRHGFAYGVLIQPSFLGYDNSQMLAAIAAQPQRLKGIAVIPTDTALPALQTLDRQGIAGIRLNLFGRATPDLGAPEWRGLLSRIDSLGWQVELHCPPAVACELLPRLRDYRGPVVLDHFGRVDPRKGVQDPDYQRLLDQLDPERHWVKVSGFYRLGDNDQGRSHARDALALLLARGMRDRLVWGSDWPHTQFHQAMDYPASLAFMDTLAPDPVLRSRILADNACRLFGFTS
ncbi:amidohydrolase family protein [Castellaniella sp.]|uniref:amidohydrolase family protein n=1 Tax=Castellaniella sp. TaxID=1955812 RepID=UPI003C73A093